MSAIGLPAGLLSEIRHMCSNLTNEEAILDRLSQDVSNLTQFFKAAVTDDQWVETHTDLTRKMILTIEDMCKRSNNEEFKKQISEICDVMLTKITSKNKSFDILKLFGVLKMALNSKSEQICGKCFPELINYCSRRYKSDVKFLQIKYQQVAVVVNDLNSITTENILKIFKENELDLVVWMTPSCKNVEELLLYLQEFGNKVYHLDLSKIGSLITEAILDKITLFCPHLRELKIVNSAISKIFLNYLDMLSFLFIRNCTDLKNINLIFLKGLETLDVISCEKLESIKLESLASLSVITLASCKNLQLFTVCSTNTLNHKKVDLMLTISEFCQLEQLPDFSDFERLSAVYVTNTQKIEIAHWMRMRSGIPATYVKLFPLQSPQRFRQNSHLFNENF